MILVTRYIVLVKTCTSHTNYVNRIDNLHNHDNSIILIFIFLIRIDTVHKPGNALITQFSDTYIYSPNLNEIDDITINNYDKIQLHYIGNL